MKDLCKQYAYISAECDEKPGKMNKLDGTSCYMEKGLEVSTKLSSKFKNHFYLH